MPLVIKTTGFEQFADPTGGSWIKCLMMGEHGVGKTRSAACWPKPIIADCERGLMSVADKGVPYAEIKGSADMDALGIDRGVARKPDRSGVHGTAARSRRVVLTDSRRGSSRD